MGRIGARILLSILEGKKNPASAEKIVLDVELIRRGSVARLNA